MWGFEIGVAPLKMYIFECLVIKEWGYLTGIMRCGLVGGRYVTVEMGFEVSEAQAMPSDTVPFCSLQLKI